MFAKVKISHVKYLYKKNVCVARLRLGAENKPIIKIMFNIAVNYEKKTAIEKS